MPNRKTWNKKTILLALHACVLAIVTALLWVYKPVGGLSSWVLIPWSAFLVSTFGLAAIPLRWFAHRRFDVLFIGGEALLLGTILSLYFRGESWLFYPLLLAAVLLAALARRLVWALGMGLAVAAAHLLINTGQAELDPGVLILQTSLILTTAGVIGYLTEELSREEATTTLLDNALEISTLLAGALEAEEVYDRLTELVARLFRAGRVAVILTDPGSGLARVASAVDQGDRVTDLEIDLARYPEIQTALDRRAPVIISRPDQHPDMAGVRSNLPGDARQSSILVVPILTDDEPRGALLVRLERAGHTFSDHEIKFVRIMADAAGQALMRAEHFAELTEAARRDSLTGLYNMRIFHRRLAEEIDRCDRSGGRLSLVMIDADYLKHVNDTYGHLAGDQVIRDMATTLLKQVRSIDTVARYGGEEFALLLPETGSERAYVVGERVRNQIEHDRHEGVDEAVTASVGISTYPDDATTATDLIHKADLALYASKNQGRNRTTRYAEIDGASKEILPIEEEEEANATADLEEDAMVLSVRDALSGLATNRETGRYFDVIASLAAVMQARDQEVFEQLKDIATVAELFLANLPLTDRQRWTIQVACLLRDIGKLAISEQLLYKQDFLTRDEYRRVRQHPVVSARIVGPVKGFDAVVPYIRHHHERWDGKGYPDGLRGEEIPYGARIVGLLDAFQAMVNRRPYADRARGLRYAYEEIRRNGGTQFDPDLAERFLQLIDGNREIISTLVAEEPSEELDAEENEAEGPADENAEGPAAEEPSDPAAEGRDEDTYTATRNAAS